MAGEVPEIQGTGREVPHQAFLHFQHAAHSPDGPDFELVHVQPVGQRPLLLRHGKRGVWREERRGGEGGVLISCIAVVGGGAKGGGVLICCLLKSFDHWPRISFETEHRVGVGVYSFCCLP